VPDPNVKGNPDDADASIDRVRCRHLPFSMRRQFVSADATSDIGHHRQAWNVELRDQG
jgi:hypothetical protein